ncbi:MAG: hypothetical protein BMS9Abin12_0813 [Acidimicrobiia bacterium]|nr:MAG: hypothetical protein BMS9Abin12_0813 [Acidimicrobiia bacterium]
MCCLFGALVLIGPRFAILVWWIFDPTRWRFAFDNFFIAVIGFFLAPWTTMMYVLVFPGGVNGFDWIILGLGILADVGSWTSGGRSGRRYRTTTYAA